MKKVTFSAEQACEPDDFHTFPKPVLKGAGELSRPRSSSRLSAAGDKSSIGLDQTVMNIYNRFVVVSEVDVDALVRHLATGNCPDLLVRYSVLNTLLKTLPPSDFVHFSDTNPVLSTRQCIDMISIANADFTKLSSPENVMELSTLQQIMRCVEGIWSHFGWESEEMKSEMQKFSQKCIQLIGDRPSSKIIVSSAIRLANTAISEKMLSNEQAAAFVSSLSCAQLLNTASFTADSISSLFSVYKLYPASILSSSEAWVHLALRGLASSFPAIRSQSYTLLNAFNHDVISVLDKCVDSQRKDPEFALARSLGLRIANFSQTPVFEDALVLAKSVILVINQAASLSSSWPHLELWTDTLQVCLRRHPRLIPSVWSSIVSCKLRDESYFLVVFAPFLILKNSASEKPTETGLDATVYTMLLDVFANVDVNDKSVWEKLLAPLLKTLATNRDYNAAAAWAHAISEGGMRLQEPLITSYLDVFDTLCKYSTRHEVDHLFTVWCALAGVCKTRISAMELVKYHYRILSPEQARGKTQGSKSSSSEPQTKLPPPKQRKTATNAPEPSRQQQGALVSSSAPSKEVSARNKMLLGFALANGLIKGLESSMLTARVNKKQHSLLTLIMLPLVMFLNAEQRLNYIEKLISANSDFINDFQREQDHGMCPIVHALIATVEAGSENQMGKWSKCAETVEKLLNFSNTQETQSSVYELLMTFVPIMKSATASHWASWSRVLSELADNNCQFKVLSKLPSQLPIDGVLSIANLPEAVNGDAATYERPLFSSQLRILLGSINNENVEVLRKELRSNECVDKLARALVNQRNASSASLAWKLLPNSRLFVVAKALIQVISDTKDPELIEFWNSTVNATLPKTCPPFVSPYQQSTLKKSVPKLKIAEFMVMEADFNTSTQDLKRVSAAALLDVTPPSNSKRPRRPILTGSIPPSLSTPPDSDNLDDLPSSVAGDDLSSSPPQRNKTTNFFMPTPSKHQKPASMGSLPKTPHDKARLLKRLLMGLNVAEACNSMKESEQLMIYNMLFKSCVALKTHIASNGTFRSEEEIEKARAELAEATSLHDALEKKEQKMVANGIAKKNSVQYDSESDSNSDDFDKSDAEDEEFVPQLNVKLEV